MKSDHFLAKTLKLAQNQKTSSCAEVNGDVFNTKTCNVPEVFQPYIYNKQIFYHLKKVIYVVSNMILMDGPSFKRK